MAVLVLLPLLAPTASAQDTTAPVYSSSTVDGTSLVITFDEALAAASNLANGAFTVKKTPSGGTETDVTLSGSPSISGMTVTLTLASAVVSTDAVTVAYVKPTSGTDNTLKDASGNETDSFSAQTVTNNTPPAIPAACSVVSGPTAYFTSVTSAAMSITVTMNGTKGGAFAIRLCGPFGANNAYETRPVLSQIREEDQEAGVTHTLSSLTPETDYWVGATSYVGVGRMNHIRTKAAGPTITISGGSAVTEGTAASFTVSASEAPTADLTVSLSVSEAAGSDFVAAGDEGSKTVTITGGSTSASFSVATVADSVDEPDGSVTVTVSTGTGYTVGSTSSATVTVSDDDVPVEVTISGGSAVTEGKAASFTVTASEAPAADLAVSLSVSEASGSDDFVASGDEGSKTVTITGGSTSATYSVATQDDTTDESSGSVTVTVSTGTGYTVGSTSSASVAVYDNDGPEPAFSSASVIDTKLTITFDSALQPLGPLTNTGFTVKKTPMGGVEADVTLSGSPSYAIDTTILTMTLGSAVAHTDAVTVAYTKPTSGVVKLTGPGGHEVDSFPAQTVTNNSLPAAPAACGGSSTSTPDVISLTSDASSITATVVHGRGNNLDILLCGPIGANGANAKATILTGVSSANGTTATITNVGAGNTGDALAPDTDYWVRADDYLTSGEWLHIRTKEATGPTITISGGSAVTEGTAASFTVTASTAPTADLTVSLSVSEAAGSDFVASGDEGSATVTITSGSTSASFSVATVADSVDEPDGSVTVTVSTGTGYTVGSTSSASVTVNDDDAASGPTITIAAGTSPVTEGTAASFTVTASTAPAADLTVSLSVSEAAGSDFVASGDEGSATVTITSGSTSASFSVATVADSVDEPDGSVTVTVSTGTGYTVGSTSSASVTVNDDDAASGPTITIAAGTSPVTEGTAASFTVTASTAPAADLTVSLSVSEAAGSDFVASGDEGSATVTITSGSTSASFSVATVADSVDEPDGSVTVTVSTGTGYTVGSTSSASVTVNDDDAASGPTITIAAGTSPVTEGTAASFTVTASTAPAADLTVSLSVSEAAGSDFVASGDEGSATVTITSGSTSASFSVATVADSVDEPDGSVTVTVSTGTGYTVGSTSSASVTVNDDDAAPSGITLSANPSTVAEDGGAKVVTVTATVNGGTRFATARTVTVSVAGSNTASAVDFAAVSDFDITVSAGAATGTGTFTLTPTDDSVDETDETITISGELTGITVGDATVSLTDDDDTPGITLSVSPATLAEDAAVADRTITVTATVTGGTTFATARTVTVSVAGSNTASAVDFAAVPSFGITVAAETTSKTGTFTLTPTDDSVDETDETITISGTLSGVTVSSTTMTLTDDDAAPTGITLSASPSTVTEDGGAKTVTVTATVNGGTRFATDKTVTVSVAGSGTATAVDFTAVSDFDITISAGAATGTGTFTLTPTDDSVDETDETITISGTLANVTVGDATVSLTDDDNPPSGITLTANPSTVAEDGGAKVVTVTATVNGTRFATAKTVTVSVAGSNTASAVDFAAVSDFDITVSAGAATGTGTFTLTPTDDSVDETDETITISGVLTGITVGDATVSLTDDDDTPGISLSVSPATLAEDAAVADRTITVTATVTGGTTFATARTVTVSVAGSNTASAVDFAAVDDFDVTVAAEATSKTGTFTLTPVDDSVDETDETITISGTLSGVTVSSTTMTLTDDDAAPTGITLSASPDTVGEAAAASVTVTATVTGGTTFATDKTVMVSVAGSGTATAVDFAAVADFNITVSAGATTGKNTFTLTPTNDVVDETDETVTVSGELAGVTVTPETVALTDDDNPPTGITLSASPDTVGEGDGATVVTVTAEVTGDTTFATDRTVAVSVAGSGTATAVDFAAVPSFNITVAAETTTKTGTFTLTPVDDDTDETHETITVSGTLAGVMMTSGTLELLDNDGPSTRITLTVSPTNLGEDDNATDVTVTATLDASALATSTTVALALDETGSTALKGADYADPGTLATITLPADSTSANATVSLDPIQDTLDEGDGETVRIGGTHSGSLTVTDVDVTIDDDDDTPTDVDLVVEPASVSETDTAATTITVSARLRGESTRTSPTLVNLNNVLGGTATVGAGNDYTHSALSAGSVTIPIGQPASTVNVTFNVTPIQDPAYEGTETIEVLGSTLVAGLTVNAAVLDLNDADVPRIDLSIDADVASAGVQTSMREDDGAQWVRVTATHAPETAEEDRAQAVVVTVTVGAAGSTADRRSGGSGGDYTSASAVNVWIPANTDSGSSFVRIAPIQDDVVEGVETVVFGGRVGDGTDFQVRSTTMTLLDDETTSTGLDLLVSRDSIPEALSSATVRVTAELNGRTLDSDTTVTLALAGTATEGEGADYTFMPLPLVIEIGAGEPSGFVEVTIEPTNDSIDEFAGETITISGTHSGSPPLAVTATDVTIVDDDTASTIVALRASPSSVAEDRGSAAAVTVTAKLAGTVTRSVATAVTLNSSLGGTAVAGAGNDYTHSGLPASITIPAGSLTASVAGLSVTPLQDSDNEGVETIEVTGASAGFKVHPATLWLIDDEVGAPGAPGEFTAELSGRNAVRLAWEAPTAPDDKPVSAYRLERRKGEDDWETVTDAIADTSSGYTDGGLDYDTVYWWRLSAQNEDGWGPATVEAEVMTSSRAPVFIGPPPEPDEDEEPTRPSQPVPPPEGFQLEDVPPSSVFAEQIAAAVRLGIFELVPSPDPDDADPDPDRPAVRFDPQQPVSRGDIAAPLVRFWSVLGQRCPRIPTRLRLADVSGTQARLDVGCLLALGITTGTTRTTYSPEQPLTRAQTASLLARMWRAAGRECPTGSEAAFTDVAAGNVHRDDIACLHALGITGGTGAGTFSPDRPITREETAALVARLHRLATEEEESGENGGENGGENSENGENGGEDGGGEGG